MANHRVALIIGNADYQPPMKLTNPVNDAALLTRTLMARGFMIVGGASTERNQTPHSEGQDPKLGGMLQLFSKFIEAVEQGAKTHGATDAVIYYAGHALQVLDKNLLVPIDPNFSGPNPLLGLVDVKRFISRATEVAGTGGSVVAFLDSCRDLGLTNDEMNRVLDAYKREYPVAHPQQDEGVEAPEQSRSRAASIGTGMSTFKMPRTPSAARTFIGFATAPGEVTYDGPKSNQNSPFAMVLAKHLDVRGLEIEDLYNRVALDVTDEVDSWNAGRPAHLKRLHQDPWSESNLNRWLYLHPSSGWPIVLLGLLGGLAGLAICLAIFDVNGLADVKAKPWLWIMGLAFGAVAMFGTYKWGSGKHFDAGLALVGPAIGFALALSIMKVIPETTSWNIGTRPAAAEEAASMVYRIVTLIGGALYLAGIARLWLNSPPPWPRTPIQLLNRILTWALPFIVVGGLLLLENYIQRTNPLLTALALFTVMGGVIYAMSVSLACRAQRGLFAYFGPITGGISVGLLMAVLFAVYASVSTQLKMTQAESLPLLIGLGAFWHLLLGAQLGYCFAYYVPDHERKKMP